MSAEQKHTPGEWEAVLNDDPRGQPVAYYPGLICTVEHGGRYLAVVAKIGCALPAQWEANARLIAAAPDLYEALRPFARFRECQRVLGGTTPKTGALYSVSTVAGEAEITVEHWEAVLSAISKAEGK